jgi:hypothetical protein
VPVPLLPPPFPHTLSAPLPEIFLTACTISRLFHRSPFFLKSNPVRGESVQGQGQGGKHVKPPSKARRRIWIYFKLRESQPARVARVVTGVQSLGGLPQKLRSGSLQSSPAFLNSWKMAVLRSSSCLLSLSCNVGGAAGAALNTRPCVSATPHLLTKENIRQALCRSGGRLTDGEVTACITF